MPVDVLQVDKEVENESTSTMVKNLLFLLREQSFLRIELRHLADLGIIRLKTSDNAVSTFSVHWIICQWILNNNESGDNHELLILATYLLAKKACSAESNKIILQRLLGLRNLTDYGVDRRFVAPFRHYFSLPQGDFIPQSRWSAQQGYLSHQYFSILALAARIALCLGKSEKALQCYFLAREYDVIRLSKQNLSWPRGQTSFQFLCGFAKAYQLSRDSQTTTDILDSTLVLCERLNGQESDETVAIATWKENTRMRHGTMQQHTRAPYYHPPRLSVFL